MPILSKTSHNKPFVQSADYEEQIEDVGKVIVNLVNLDISYRLKKDMVKHAVWEITKANGDFKGRYRSQATLTAGPQIQRDHVWQKNRIIEHLLADPEDLNIVLKDLIHCVVTKAEHIRLTEFSKKNTDVDGWDRYKACGIIVIDTATGRERDFS